MLAHARRPQACERGSAVVESAIAMPALIAVTAALMWLIGVGVVHARVDEAAFSAARLAARGGTGEAVREQVLSRLPGATVEIEQSPDAVKVTVTQRLVGDVPLLRVVDHPVSVSAVVPLEVL